VLSKFRLVLCCAFTYVLFLDWKIHNNVTEIPSRSDQNYQEKSYFGPKYLNYGSVYQDHFHCKIIPNICSFKPARKTWLNLRRSVPLTWNHGLNYTYSNIIDNMQHKHILLASKAKHSLTSQVKIRGYIKPYQVVK